MTDPTPDQTPRWRPSPATVIACVALAVALGGTSYAAVTLPRNSVGTPQIKASAVNSAKIKDGSVAAVDLVPALRRGVAGATGAQGPAGPAGATGPAGAAGAAGPAGATGATGATGASGVASQAGTDGEPQTQPAASNSSSVETRSFTLTSAGKLMLFGRGRFQGTCAGGAVPVFGIYLDGTAIPYSGFEGVDATNYEISLFGVTTAQVSAGLHTATLRVGCDDNTAPTLAAGLNHAIGFINVGG